MARKQKTTQASDMGHDAEDAQVVQPERSKLMFDPYLTSDHPFVKAIAGNLTESYELLWRGGQRKMKAKDLENTRAMLMAVFANLALSAAEGIRPPSVGISLRAAKLKVTRYARPSFSGLPALLDKVAIAGGGLKLTKSNAKGTASTLTTGAHIEEPLVRFKFRPEDFSILAGGETIWLSKVSKRDYVTDSVERELIDYRDTPETIRFRSEMATINLLIQSADIKMAQGYQGSPVLTVKKELHRAFNLAEDEPECTERFDRGGRLFGGWWQNLPKDQRHFIRINGEPVADLDFASMFLRLAYLAAGVEPPQGDLYATISGLSEPQWRAGVKKVVLAMLFRTSPLKRLPKDCEGLLPDRKNGASVRKAILEAHPALAPIFETGIGMSLMFQESQILVAALLKLAVLGIPALPMHDGLMCQKSKEAAVLNAMQDAAFEVVGFKLPISLK